MTVFKCQDCNKVHQDESECPEAMGRSIRVASLGVAQRDVDTIRALRNDLQGKIVDDLLRFTKATGCPIRGMTFEKFGKGLGTNGTEIVESYAVRLDVDL